jgi:hypothetical protein
MCILRSNVTLVFCSSPLRLFLTSGRGIWSMVSLIGKRSKCRYTLKRIAWVILAIREPMWKTVFMPKATSFCLTRLLGFPGQPPTPLNHPTKKNYYIKNLISLLLSNQLTLFFVHITPLLLLLLLIRYL